MRLLNKKCDSNNLLAIYCLTSVYTFANFMARNVKLSAWCKLGRIIWARGNRSCYCCIPGISNL